MSASKQIGTKCIVGIVEAKPLAGFPVGKIKVRQRPGKVVRVFVRTPSGACFEYAVKEVGGKWMPAILLGSNLPY